MNDMRQKLLPVFLEEAGRKLLQLDGFLTVTDGEERSLDELESAFRAAHTLKGTAALVQADAVRSLSARMEGLLEGHFEQGRFPSVIEYEAMQLALERLRRLVNAVEKKQPEPPGVLAEAELFLKLATANPGIDCLADLLGAEDQADPFGDDPDLDDLTRTAEAAAAEDMLVDPFGDDPDLDDLTRTAEPAAAGDMLVDPFAEDPDLGDSTRAAESAAAGDMLVDPFADDPDLGDSTAIAEYSASGDMLDDPFADDPAIELVFNEKTDSTSVADSGEIDPFADDPELEVTLSEEVALAPDSPVAGFSDNSDPFADDPELECQNPESFADIDVSEPVLPSSPVPPLYKNQDSPEIPTGAEVQETAQPSSFIERMRQRIEKESPLQTAERLAKTLLSQYEGDVVARQYASCNFTVAAKEYYLPIGNMIEITDLPKITSLPLAPVVVRGLINLRGQVLPVIDLGIQAGAAPYYQAVRKLIIAEAGGEKLAFLSDGIPDLSETVLGEKVDVMNFIDQFRAGAS